MIVEAKRTLAIHHRRCGIALRAGVAGVVYVMSGTRVSHSLTPSGIIYIFDLHADRSIRVERLLARPCNWPEYSRAKFNFRRKPNLSNEAVGQQKSAFTVAAAAGLSGIK